MDFSSLPPEHFLALPRPNAFQDFAQAPGIVDTTTLAAHDFDVDNRTGFMPPDPPLARLPALWEVWEVTLDDAMRRKLQLGAKLGISEADKVSSEAWRRHVRELPVLPITQLLRSELVLRRAHTVLAWTMHFYIHSLPPSTESIHIPASISLPLLRVSSHLRLPPVLTYSDDVLYNWALIHPSSSADITPALDNLRCNTLFTSTKDEEEFYLASARMELRGVEALEVMRMTMDEVFAGDRIAVGRVSEYLRRLAVVIGDLEKLLMAVREGCDPRVFYHEIRPWFKGIDSHDGAAARQWIFEGLEEDPTLQYPTELSGPSAGQSALIHSLDLFLGVDQYSHSANLTGQSGAQQQEAKPSFLDRMRVYMPRHHRNFLNHLAANPRPLRGFVDAMKDEALLEGYNLAVKSLKKLRDAHLIIVTMYIVQPARKAHAQEAVGVGKEGVVAASRPPLKGTGGTEMMKFLKGVRDATAGAVMDTAAS